MIKDVLQQLWKDKFARIAVIILGIIYFALFFAVVVHRQFNGLLGQHRAVDLLRGEPLQGLDHVPVFDLQGVVHALADDHAGGHGAGGDGRRAAEGLEFGVLDDVGVLVDLQVDLHDVPAGGVAHGAHAVGVLDDPHVLGMGKGFHDFFAIHV